MRHHPRCSVFLLTILTGWSTACVEPPPTVNAPDDMRGNMNADMPSDAQSTSDMTPEAAPAMARIVIGDPAADTIEINGYAKKPLKIEVFDRDGKLVPDPQLSISFSQQGSPIATLGYTEGVLYSTEPGNGTISVTASALGIAATKAYRIFPFAPKFDIPRILHLPYTQTINLEDVLRVTEFGGQEMSVDAWFKQLNDTPSGNPVTISLSTKDPDGNDVLPLNDTVRSDVPKTLHYTLTIASARATLAAPTTTFDITIITEPDTQLTAGMDHYCKLVKGTASCWGGNSSGQLGTGSLVDRLSPTPVDPSIPFIQIESKKTHTCGISKAQQAYCWGSNADKESSRTSAALNTPSPTLVAPPTKTFDTHPLEAPVADVRFTQISAGESHTCALSTRGVVYCWGDDSRGQRGVGSLWTEANVSMDRAFPPIELGANDYGVRFQKVSAGFDHTCALSFSNELFCWGDNNSLQSNPGDNRDKLLPTRILAPEALFYTDLWTGPTNTCAQTSDGAVYCWGDNVNQRTSIDTTELTIPSPQKLTAYHEPSDTPLPEVLELSLGQHHSCALSRRDNQTSLHCWGLGLYGELGLGDVPLTGQEKTNDLPQSGLHTTRDAVLADIDTGRDLDLALLSDSTCLLDRKNGRTSCWGARTRGAHGDNTNALHPPPTGRQDYTQILAYPNALAGVAHVAPVIKPALTLESTCLLVPGQNQHTDQLVATCWGSTLYGQSADATLSIVSPFDPARQMTDRIAASPLGLSASTYQACFIGQTDPNTQRCWGQNRRSPDAVKLLTQDEEQYLGKPQPFNSPKRATHIVMSRVNTCSWHESDSKHPPVCRGPQMRGALGNAHESSFVDNWTGIANNQIGSYTLENKIFADNFNTNNEETVIAMALGELTGCMIRKSLPSDGAPPATHTYALWCWGDLLGSWGIAYANPDKPYAVQKLWETTDTRDPLALGLGDIFGCLVDASGALQCWGNPPLKDRNEDNRTPPPFQLPTPFLPEHTFSDIQITDNTACLRHASLNAEVVTPLHALTCFGHNGEGQAGAFEPNGTVSRRAISDPLRADGSLETVPLGGLDELYQFTVGAQHTCVTGRFMDTPMDAIELACWGLDTHGQSRSGLDKPSQGIIVTASLPPATISP